jgi:phage/plasmid-associated DNA primase
MITDILSIVNSVSYYTDAKMKCYDNIVYTPCFDGVMDEKYFNTWDGWNVMKYPKCVDYSKCEVFLTHLKEVWCNGCEVSYKWFLEYLSFIVRGGRTCVGVILRGGQGCGKDCFMTDLLMNRVLGQKFCMMTNDPVNQLFGKFNSSLLNKSLVVIAEGGYDLDKCYSNIKDLITNGVLRIEKKFADITPNVNYANFMISTNAYDIIKDGKGRRLGYWSCSDKYKGNKKYFDRFYDAVNDDDAVSAFYNLLIDKEMVFQADIEDLAYLQSTMPQTKLSKDIAVKNTPIVSQFLNGYFKMSKLEEYIELKKDVKVKRSELYSAYKRFCDKCGYERLKMNLFSAQLLNLHNVECKKHSDYWFIFSVDILICVNKGLQDLEKEGADFKLADMITHTNTADFEDEE